MIPRMRLWDRKGQSCVTLWTDDQGCGSRWLKGPLSRVQSGSLHGFLLWFFIQASSPASSQLTFQLSADSSGIITMAKFFSCFPAQFTHFIQTQLANFRVFCHLRYQSSALANMKTGIIPSASHQKKCFSACQIALSPQTRSTGFAPELSLVL